MHTFVLLAWGGVGDVARRQEDLSFSSAGRISKILPNEMECGVVAQCEGPGFNPQNCQSFGLPGLSEQELSWAIILEAQGYIYLHMPNHE